MSENHISSKKPTFPIKKMDLKKDAKAFLEKVFATRVVLVNYSGNLILIYNYKGKLIRSYEPKVGVWKYYSKDGHTHLIQLYHKGELLSEHCLDDMMEMVKCE